MLYKLTLKIVQFFFYCDLVFHKMFLFNKKSFLEKKGYRLVKETNKNVIATKDGDNFFIKKVSEHFQFSFECRHIYELKINITFSKNVFIF